MKGYNYLEAVTDDVLQYLKDSVTGNGSGSYTFDADQAAEYVIPNLNLFADAAEEFGDLGGTLRQGVEAMDVTIRCYLLGQAIAAALDEVEDAPVTDSVRKGRPSRSAIYKAVEAAKRANKSK